MIFAAIVHKTVEKIMADANETKARIQEIRSRVFQEPSKENLTSDITDVTPEPVLDTKKLEKLTPKEIKPDLIKKEDSIRKEGSIRNEDFIKKEDFVNFKNQLNNDIKDYFSALDEKLTKTLNSFETKIPDIKKGSTVREQLDNEIGDIISQRMIQQSRTLNRAIDDRSGSYVTTSGLGEMKKGLEEAFERQTNIKLEKIFAENKRELDLSLVENLDKLEEFNSSIRGDFSSFIEDFTSLEKEIETKLQLNDDKITLLSADVGNKIAKTTLSVASKNSALEESLFHKVEYYFEENTNKLNQLEGILTDSIISSSKAFDCLKQDLEIRLDGSLDKLEGLNSSIREDFSSLLQEVEHGSEKSISKFKELEDSVTDSIISSSRASVAIKNDLEIGLAEGLDKLEEFNNFIREDFSSFTGGFTSSIDEIDIKLKQNDEEITLLGCDVRNKIAKIILDFSTKNSLLEDTLSQKVGDGVEESISKFNEFKGIITNSMVSSFKASDAIKKDLELGLKCSLDKLEEFNSSIRKDFTSANDVIDIKLKQNDDKITRLSTDTKNLISKTTLDFQKESSALEDSLLQKVMDSSEKNMSKFKELEGIVTDSIINSFKVSDATKKDLEVGLKGSLDKLEEFNSSIREEFSTLVSSFTSSNEEIDITLKQNDDKIKLLSADMQNLISKTALDFDEKNRALEESLLQKLEVGDDKNTTKFTKFESILADNFKRSSNAVDAVKHDLEVGLVENLDKLEEFNSSIRKDLSVLVSSFTSSNEEIDTKLKQNDYKIKLLSSDMRNKIAKITLEFKNKNSSLEGSALKQTEKVSGRLSKVEAEIKNNMGELRSVIKENLVLSSDVKGHVDGLHQSIELLEAMIVREEDLTALFQNYTLNLNIIRDVNDVQFARTHPSKTGL